MADGGAGLTSDSGPEPEAPIAPSDILVGAEIETVPDDRANHGGTMQRAADLDEIHDLIARYTLYIDTGRAEEWGSLFTEDGELHFGRNEPTRGREALVRFARNTDPGLHHYIVDEAVDVAGDRATCTCSLLVSKGQPPTFVLVGRYRDDLVREAGRWRFARRVVRADRREADATSRPPAEPNPA